MAVEGVKHSPVLSALFKMTEDCELFGAAEFIKALAGQVQRCMSTQTDGEIRIAKILKEKFPLASSLKVLDISGGCGAMYEIHIESNEFKGKRTVQQHQLVNQALKEEIQGMHGLRIFTDVPKQ